MTVLFDSNALIDLLTGSEWADWVQSQMELFSAEEFAINPIIYAEVAVPYESKAALDDDLQAVLFTRLELPWEAAFLAGKAFGMYRRRGGQRISPLPDFYIGAHAVVAEMPLITRDATRYRTYFPGIRLVAPN